jgi:hypothetical protein
MQLSDRRYTLFQLLLFTYYRNSVDGISGSCNSFDSWNIYMIKEIVDGGDCLVTS